MVLVLAIPAVVLLGPMVAGSGHSAAPRPQSVTGVSASLVAGPLVAQTPSTFWGEVVQTDCATCIATDPAVGAFLNASPFTWVRYGQGSDECNLSADRSYGPNGAVTGGCGFNIPALKRWCDSRLPHCHVILGLPGENNNSAEDAAIAKYVVQSDGFQPDYWAIGNEPTGWTHYGIPWTKWATTDHAAPTPLAYAFDLRAAIAAVRAVDPGAKFIGVQAACSCNGAWFTDVASVDGASVSAYAYHSYPSSVLRTTETLQELYDPLASKANLTSSFAAVRAAISAGCANCATLPVFVDEYNAGPGWAPSNWGGTYANAVFLAASVTQALRANVSQLAPFDLQTFSTTGFGYSMMNGKDVVAPPGTLFTHLLSHLATGSVYAANVRTTVPGVWSVLTENSSAVTFLVVNTNLTHAIALSLGSVLLASTSSVAYAWSPGASAPNRTSGPLGSVYSVPSQGILLLSEPRSVATLAVRASATPRAGSAPLPVQFLGNASGGSPPYRYAWSFGDGGSSTLAGPLHTYTARGSYNATVRVSDARGTITSTSLALSVGAALHVSVTTGTLLGVGPLCIGFSASPSGGTSPYHALWRFGDGTPSASGVSVKHCYRGLGVYTARVNVSDAAGHSVALSVGPITVLPLLPFAPAVPQGALSHDVPISGTLPPGPTVLSASPCASVGSAPERRG